MRKLHPKFILILKFVILITFVFCFVVFGYVYYVLGQAKLKVAELRLQKSTFVATPAKLEGGSFVKAEHLEKYFLATGQKQTFKKWLNPLIADGVIELEKPHLNITEDTQLPAVLENSCKRYKCLQYRVGFDEIPPSLWKGLLGVEDFRFLEHRGVDIISILRAIIVDIKAMKLIQGGSTLTQQLVKNLFLTNEKKFERKIREIIYAIYLERVLSKEEIITAYFNEVFWGTHQGVYLKGIAAASLAYFGKKTMELSEFEAAILIGLLKGPYYYHPIKHPDRLQNRAAVVFERLKGLKLLKDNVVSWSTEKWSTWLEELKDDSEKNYLYSHYLLKDEPNEFWNSFEKFVFYQSVHKVKKLLSERIQGKDIAIKHFAVPKNCLNSKCDEFFSFYSKSERNKQVALFEERHQVGSILKPIIYEQFIHLGKMLSDTISTDPINLKLVSGDWSPKDASKVHEKEMTLLKALQKSKNIPLIRAAQEVGFDKLEKQLLEFFPNMLTPLGEFPAQLLGAIELSLAEVIDAYLKFLSQTCEKTKNGDYSFEDSILYYLSRADQTTVAKVASNIIKEVNLFGKTGTSNKGLDNWYVAFDGEQLYVTWLGVESQRSSKKVRLSGATSAYRIFQEFILLRGRRVAEVYCF